MLVVGNSVEEIKLPFFLFFLNQQDNTDIIVFKKGLNLLFEKSNYH